MSLESILTIILILAVGFLYYDRFGKNRTELPKLEPGERIPTIPEGHSNITIARKANKVVFTDEQENEFEFKETLK